MEQDWEAIYKDQGYRAVYPSEYIIRFISKYYGKLVPFTKHEEFKELKVLDLGCGSGRHVIFLANENFDTYGLEQSEEGVKFTQQWLKFKNLNASVIKGMMTEIPFDNEFFDVLVDFQSIQHNVWKDIKASAEEIYRVLKKEGMAFLVIRSSEDYLANKGIVIETNTCSNIQEGDMMDAGICHFFTKKEIDELFSKFKVLSIDKNLRSVENGKFITEWLITLKK